MRTVTFLLFALITTSLGASAISVASDYLANGTLELIGGASKIYSIRIQNPTDEEVGIKLDYDADFMKVIDYKRVYLLQPKETGYRILFDLTAPKKPGFYKVGYTVSEVEPSGSGGLPIRLKINRNFNLKVVENPNKSQINYYYMAYGAIALAVLLYIVGKKRLSKRSKHSSRRFL